MVGLTIPKPQFPDDDGSADPRLAETLAGYAEGGVGEHAVLEQLYGARLLVPVVSILTQEAEPAPDGLRREKESEMAVPTLIGADGRRGVLGFTSVETMALWRPDARPVAVNLREACESAMHQNADALVIDVAGPVQFAIDGVRLHLLAEGRRVPPPHEDPDVLAAIEAAFGGEDGVVGVRVGPGTLSELSVRFTVLPGFDERGTVQRVSDRLAEQLRGRIVGGVELGALRG